MLSTCRDCDREPYKAPRHCFSNSATFADRLPIRQPLCWPLGSSEPPYARVMQTMRSPHVPCPTISHAGESLYRQTEMMHAPARAWIGPHLCGARSSKLSVQRGR